MAHLSDVTETRGIINVVKLLNFCNWHFQFYVLSRFLYNKLFFSNCKNWGQKLDLIEYGFFVRCRSLSSLTLLYFLPFNILLQKQCDTFKQSYRKYFWGKGPQDFKGEIIKNYWKIVCIFNQSSSQRPIGQKLCNLNGRLFRICSIRDSKG